MSVPPTGDLLDVQQAAARLGTSPRFVRRLVSDRRIRFYKIGRYVRLHPDDLAEFIRRGAVEPVAPRRRYRNGQGVYG